MIKLDDVSYSYDGTDLLHGISMHLAKGSFHFLTGPSGAGKSTLLKLLYGELTPTKGMVSLENQDLRGLDRDGVAMLRRYVGIVHQDCQFLDHLNLWDNVTLPLRVASEPTKPQDVADLLGWVGLTSRVEATPPELSGGERQRAALARAVVMSPEVVIADEPTGNIDWEMSKKLLSLLIELNKMGKTILIATHDLALIRAAKSEVAARVLRISNRQVIQAGADL
ncbi:cell division ATP-binding protein FtsE [Algirhabdus cladophorae]|uniref:cell division ATP-binding protein FtsE n=1 Tax=Algirhabdus cladophorae TaxID=3377108 RepID=UPI003B84954C